MLLDVLGSFQDPLNLDQGAAKLVNVRVVPRDPKGGQKGKVRFTGAPGLSPICRPTTLPCIAISHALETIWTGHADGSIYYGVETGAPSFAGFVAVNPALPIIRFAEDRTALAIASNGNVLNPKTPALAGTGYVATPAGGAVNAGFDTSIDFDPSTVAELDNQALWSAASNFYANQDAKVYRSQPLAPANVQPNSFGTKEARADKVLDIAISGRIAWVLGSRSCEQWYDSGASTDMPFVPYPNSLNSVGLAVRLTMAVLRDIIMFVGTDRRVWLCSGQSGQAVSPPWLDLLLQQMSLAELATLTAYAYGQGGSDFYVLTRPGLWSLELAGATGVWSYRKSPGRLDHAGRCATEHDGGITYVGMDTGEVCFVDLSSSTEPSGTLERAIITQWVGSQETKTTFSSVDVTSSMGPQAGDFQLDWSETNDVTVDEVTIVPRIWRGARTIQMPKTGEVRAIARSLGTGRRRQFRLQYSGSQAPFTIDEMYVN